MSVHKTHLLFPINVHKVLLINLILFVLRNFEIVRNELVRNILSKEKNLKKREYLEIYCNKGN